MPVESAAELTGPDGLPVLAFATQGDWRDWLAREHEVSAGVWLRIARAGTGAPSVTYQEALEVALGFGWIDGQKAADGDGWWRQRFTPRRRGSKWSKVNRDKAEALIAAGQMSPAGLREVEAAKADGRWAAAYAGSRAATVPPDLVKALDAEPAARAAWDALDRQNRYAVLYRVDDAKKPETRARRIEKFVAMLAAGETLHPRRGGPTS